MEITFSHINCESRETKLQRDIVIVFVIKRILFEILKTENAEMRYLKIMKYSNIPCFTKQKIDSAGARTAKRVLRKKISVECIFLEEGWDEMSVKMSRQRQLDTQRIDPYASCGVPGWQKLSVKPQPSFPSVPIFRLRSSKLNCKEIEEW